MLVLYRGDNSVTAETKLREMTGPGTREQWLHWKHRTPEHRNRIAAKNEVHKILSADKVGFI